jgi:hypothetical protein
VSSASDDTDVGQTSTTDTEDADEDQSEDADTFPRSYVERLRRESAGYRERAQTADTYAKRLHLELVRATGRLADPTDLEFDEKHLDDPDALVAARRRPIDSQAAPGQQSARRRNRTRGLTSGGE